MSPREARPWRRALVEEAALPSSLHGPVENFAFSRLAASCFSVVIGMFFLSLSASNLEMKKRPAEVSPRALVFYS